MRRGRKALLTIITIMAALAAVGCGDTTDAEEATEDCKRIGASCDGEQAINCELHCDNVGGCTAAREVTVCGAGATCQVTDDPLREWGAAHCMVDGDLACDPLDQDTRSCVDDDVVEFCEVDQERLVRYACGATAEAGGWVNGCVREEGGDDYHCDVDRR